MKFWNRKESPAQPSGLPIFDTPPTWLRTLTSPEVRPRVVILLGLLAAALLIVQLPRTPLPVRKGERTTHPILARVEFNYVDQDVTTAVRNLAALVRVPSIYDSEPRQVAAMKDSLAALAAAAAKAAALEQLPEAVQKEWKIAPETFAALKAALGEKGENLPAAQETLTKAMTTLTEPTNLPIVSEEGFQRSVRLPAIKELRDRLPAGLSPEVAPILEEPQPIVIVVTPQGDLTVPIQDVLTAVQIEPIGARLERLLGPALHPIFGEAGVAALAAAMAPRIGPTLIYDAVQTENRRAAAKELVKPVPVQRKANTTLVEAGKEITDADVKLLEQEQAARLADLGWARRLLAWLGAIVVLGLLVTLLAASAVRLQPNVAKSFPRSLILAALCVLVLGAAKAVAQGRGPPEFYTFLLTTAGMTVAVAYTRTFALAMVWTLIFLVAVATQADLDWAITAAAGSSVAILSLDAINNRSKLIEVGALAGAAFFAARAGLALWRTDYTDGDMFPMILWPATLYFGVGLGAGVVMLAILPFIERAFGIVTNISLLELCDVNQPALRRLALEAPGTYTHSLLIGTLAEAAADRIGARGLLARVGAYFHDIGKALKPMSFGENRPAGEVARDAPPITNHEIIIRHVKDGLDMADRLGLPPIIRQFIAEHHGTCLMEYFYREAVRQAAQAKRDPPPESNYRYPGPKPRSRETAIVMLADAAEGLTRSLTDRSPPKVGAAVHDIVMKRLLDGQLDASGLTLTDLHTVEETLTKTLLSVYHARTVYPSDRRSAESSDGGARGDISTLSAKGRPETGSIEP
ncbi:MAG: HDIG domain-containing protein [Planctomycetota bacterium]|nr:HDIG domain-containing protein [Planctomycetota bacterium]